MLMFSHGRVMSFVSANVRNSLFARTVNEVADQLVRFHGLPGDELYKHLRRSSSSRRTATVSAGLQTSQILGSFRYSVPANSTYAIHENHRN